MWDSGRRSEICNAPMRSDTVSSFAFCKAMEVLRTANECECHAPNPAIIMGVAIMAIAEALCRKVPISDLALHYLTVMSAVARFTTHPTLSHKYCDRRLV